MDYKKKYFDDMIENDNKGTFLLTASAQCFNECVPKIVAGDLSSDEKSCFLNCYTKMYASHVMTGTVFKST
jgi:hypothetical protein